MKKLVISVFLFSLLLAGCSSSNIDELSSTLQDINQLIEDAEQIASTYAEEANTIIDSNIEQAEQNLEALATEALGSISPSTNSNETVTTPDEYDYVLIFPSNDYPETAFHILGAIEQGHSDVCTIDREGADDNRKVSLKGIPTRDDYDRDEWPMAMCQEGGTGASVAYISPSDNRGAGSWVGHELSQYENGERVLFIVEKPTFLFP